MADMMKLAEDLGKELANQPATKKFMELQQQLSKDEDAQELLNEYEQQAQKMSQAQSQGEAIEPQDKQKLSDMQNKLSGNEVVKNFLSARVEYADMLRKINETITAQLAPEQGTSEENE